MNDQLQCVMGAALLLALVADAAHAQSPTVEASPSVEELQQSFRTVATLYDIKAAGTKLDLRPTPLLNWTNPERLSEQGAVFVWLDRGEPAVIGTFFTYVYEGETRAKHELQSVAQSKLTARFRKRLAWTPKQPGVTWERIDHGRPPTSSRPANLTQMRALARLFQVRMTDPNGDVVALRQLPRPLLRFQAPAKKVVDGAVFSYAVATDPEALLLVRAIIDGDQKHWEYAFARFNNNQIEAKRDSKLVWRVEEDEGMMMNRLGDEQHFQKTYNSFHPEEDLLYRAY